MTITLKIEATSATGFNHYVELTKHCPYIDDGRMIGSINCLYCKHCKDSDFDCLTIDCSYEYDHLKEE